jgi:hypothetical protein
MNIAPGDLGLDKNQNNASVRTNDRETSAVETNATNGTGAHP